jgi:hypothetical protein
MKKRKSKLEVLVNKVDSVGLFSGRYKSQVFKDKRDKLEQERIKEKSKKYENYM